MEEQTQPKKPKTVLSQGIEDALRIIYSQMTGARAKTQNRHDAEVLDRLQRAMDDIADYVVREDAEVAEAQR